MHLGLGNVVFVSAADTINFPAPGPGTGTYSFYMFLLCLRNQRRTTPCNEIDLERSAMRRSGFVANNSHQCFCTSCGRFSAGALRSKPDEDHGAGVCKGSSFASCSVFLALPRILTVWGVPVDMNRVSIVHGNPAIKLRFV